MSNNCILYTGCLTCKLVISTPLKFASYVKTNYCYATVPDRLCYLINEDKTGLNGNRTLTINF